MKNFGELRRQSFFMLVAALLSAVVVVGENSDGVASYAPKAAGRTQLQSFLQCNLCSNVDLENSGNVSDCNCDFLSVNQAVTQFFDPLLSEITGTRFFRYFRVDLEKECPFWQEEGSCMMEGCSVCACEEEEVPKNWNAGSGHYFPGKASSSSMSSKKADNLGWISSGGMSDKDEEQTAFMESPRDYYDGDMEKPWTKGGLSPGKEGSQDERRYIEFLRGTEDDGGRGGGHGSSAPTEEAVGDIFWTDMAEDDCARGGIHGEGQCGTERQVKGAYINLLENPEGYTGYSGESPQRVWRAIQEENCFGDVQDQCLEKRVFYRLMSGLQSSISTHVAKEYYFEHSATWGHNIPLYIRAVGSHKDRLDNLYFAFLFTLRAVIKAGDNLVAYSYDTGHKEEDQQVRTLVSNLVHASLPSSLLRAVEDGSGALWDLAGGPSGDGGGHDDEDGGVNLREDVQECRSGFDERDMFQVPTGYYGQAYWQKVEESTQLRDSFQHRFQNITRIMDCVTCDRCRVWGKLQILGLGTAIRILLSSDEVLSGPGGVLSRQEVIALINVLHQLSTSVAFASRAAELELEHKLGTYRLRLMVGVGVAVLVMFLSAVIKRRQSVAARRGNDEEGEEVEVEVDKDKGSG